MLKPISAAMCTRNFLVPNFKVKVRKIRSVEAADCFVHSNPQVGQSVKQVSKLSFSGSQAIFNKFYRDLTGQEAKKVLDSIYKQYGMKVKFLTEFDTGNILIERCKKALANLMELDLDDVPKKILGEIRAPFYEQMTKAWREGKLRFITGLPGSGKSTIVKSDFSKGYFTPDSDAIKKLLPGFEKYGSDYVHRASSKLNEELIKEAYKDKYNVVWQTLGRLNSLEKKVIDATVAGYDIGVIHSNVDIKTSMERVARRFQADGQFVDPFQISKEMGEIANLPAELKKWVANGIIESLKIYDNNGAPPPKLVEELLKGGIINIFK